jgi:hypothetical protein
MEDSGQIHTPADLLQEKDPPRTHWTPEPVWRREKFIDFGGDQTPISRFPVLQPSHYINWAIQANTKLINTLHRRDYNHFALIF